MPGTWASWGYPVDDDGNPTGSEGAGDPNNPGDAVMAQAYFMCALADQLREPYEAGRLTGFNSIQEVILAAYNSGPGNVLGAGGMPNIQEAQDYVRIISGNLEKYQQAVK